MPALCSMLSGTCYAQNYASIIGGSLADKHDYPACLLVCHFQYVVNNANQSCEPLSNIMLVMTVNFPLLVPSSYFMASGDLKWLVQSVV